MVLEEVWINFFAGLTAVMILLGLYIYLAFTWMDIAKKVNYRKPWFAFIPFANVVMWLEMGGFHWALVFLLLIPILGWLAILVLIIISHWKTYQQIGYRGWLVLLLLIDLIPGLLGVGTIIYSIISGVVAWKKN